MHCACCHAAAFPHAGQTPRFKMRLLSQAPQWLRPVTEVTAGTRPLEAGPACHAGADADAQNVKNSQGTRKPYSRTKQEPKFNIFISVFPSRAVRLCPWFSIPQSVTSLNTTQRLQKI